MKMVKKSFFVTFSGHYHKPWLMSNPDCYWFEVHRESPDHRFNLDSWTGLSFLRTGDVPLRPVTARSKWHNI